MRSIFKLLNKYLPYILVFSLPLTHPFVRFVTKVLFLLNLSELKKFKKIDLVVLIIPFYQLIQSLLYGKVLTFMDIPQGITPVLSYSIRFIRINVKTAFKFLLLGICILAISVIFQALFGIPDYKDLINLWKVEGITVHIIRPYHTFLGNVLTAGAFLSIGFFLSVFFVLEEGKVYYFLSLILTLTALLFTFDRTYWVSTFTTLILLFILIEFIKRELKFVSVSLIVLILSFTAITSVQPIKQRLVSITDIQKNQSNKYRIAMWKGGIEYFLHAPIKEKLFGVSRFYYRKKLKNFIKEEEIGLKLPVRMFSHLHSDFITVLVWYGILGLVLFLFVFGYLIKKNFKLFLVYENYIFIFFFCSYVTLLIAGIFEYNFEDESVKYLIYTLFALNSKIIIDGIY